MGVQIFATQGSGRARCQDCENQISQDELCVYSCSTGVSSSMTCSGYVCWICFCKRLPSWKECQKAKSGIARRRRQNKEWEKKLKLKGHAEI